MSNPRKLFIVVVICVGVTLPAIAWLVSAGTADRNAGHRHGFPKHVFAAAQLSPQLFLPSVSRGAGAESRPPTGPTPAPGGSTFSESFDGAPSTPAPWHSSNWDTIVHSRAVDTWATLEPVHAHHGMDCGAPPATHAVSAHADMLFLCRDHLMTSLNATDYGVIYLTPDHMADFSTGEAVIRFDMSTVRTSQRDWVDIWITPFADNLVLPIDEAPDLQGPPKRAVQIRMGETGPDNKGTFFRANIFRNHQPNEVTRQMDAAYGTWLEESAARRDTFEIRISRTHLKVWMPAYDKVWIDTDIADLGWSQGVVQFGHHSYNPTKCDGGCVPNTWHWDNVQIAPAARFSMIHAPLRMVSGSLAPVVFPRSAPANARLRFAAYGNNVEVSFDGGATWLPAQKQAQIQDDDSHFRSYWMPIPAGITTVQFRGQSIADHGWHINDIAIWAP